MQTETFKKINDDKLLLSSGSCFSQNDKQSGKNNNKENLDKTKKSRNINNNGNKNSSKSWALNSKENRLNNAEGIKTNNKINEI